MLKVIYALLAALRGCLVLETDDILIVVSRIKSAWMRAMLDVEMFKNWAGDGLNLDVSVHQVGLLAAKERLASLVQKIGALTQEVQQLFDLDHMPKAAKSKMGEALRTMDASSIVSAAGWQGWLQYALMYRRVSVTADPIVVLTCTSCEGMGCELCYYEGTIKSTVNHFYDHHGLCVMCGGTGHRTKRVKRKVPKVIKQKLACDWGYDSEGTAIRVQHYETITQTHKVSRCKCRNCKGTGKRKSNNKPMPMPYDLIDVIEMIGIMQALDEFTEGKVGGVRGHILKENNLPKDAGPGLAEAGDLHERMHHNAMADIYDRENEPGGDSNTNPEDRTFSMEEEFHQAEGQFNVSLLKQWKGKREDDHITIDLHDPFMPVDLNSDWAKTRVAGMTTLSGDSPRKTFDKETPLKFGMKNPSFYTLGHCFRGVCEYENVWDWARACVPVFDDRKPSVWDNYGRGKVLQELISDRIYCGAFAFDPEFHTYRSTKMRKSYLTQRWQFPRHHSRFASIYIKIDDEIAACFRRLPKGAEVLNLSITGEMAALLKRESATPSPQWTVQLECTTKTGYVKMPVAHYQDGKWSICNHVPHGDYRTRLLRMIETSTLDSVHKSIKSKVCAFDDGGHTEYPGYKGKDRWVITGPKRIKKTQ